MIGSNELRELAVVSPLPGQPGWAGYLNYLRAVDGSVAVVLYDSRVRSSRAGQPDNPLELELLGAAVQVAKGYHEYECGEAPPADGQHRTTARPK